MSKVRVMAVLIKSRITESDDNITYLDRVFDIKEPIRNIVCNCSICNLVCYIHDTIYSREE